MLFMNSLAPFCYLIADLVALRSSFAGHVPEFDLAPFSQTGDHLHALTVVHERQAYALGRGRSSNRHGGG